MMPGPDCQLSAFKQDCTNALFCAGTTFSDVTDSVGLCPHETTIFSACIAPAIMVQVTSRRIQLCNISGLAASASAAGELPS